MVNNYNIYANDEYWKEDCYDDNHSDFDEYEYEENDFYQDDDDDDDDIICENFFEEEEEEEKENVKKYSVPIINIIPCNTKKRPWVPWAKLKGEDDENMVILGKVNKLRKLSGKNKKQIPEQTVNKIGSKNFFFNNIPKIKTNLCNQNKLPCQHHINQKCKSYRCNFAHDFDKIVICQCNNVEKISDNFYKNKSSEFICRGKHDSEYVESWILRQNSPINNITDLYIFLKSEIISENLKYFITSAQNCRLNNIFFKKPIKTLEEFMEQQKKDDDFEYSEDDEWW